MIAGATIAGIVLCVFGVHIKHTHPLSFPASFPTVLCTLSLIIALLIEEEKEIFRDYVHCHESGGMLC